MRLAATAVECLYQNGELLTSGERHSKSYQESCRYGLFPGRPLGALFRVNGTSKITGHSSWTQFISVAFRNRGCQFEAQLSAFIILKLLW